ncbi:MAG: hypothetical protein QXR30_01625 [Candidatus Woesearchaeota archaeon]
MLPYQQYILVLEKMGLFSVILPCIIFYILIVSALNGVKIIKEERFKKMLALALTLFIVLPFALRPTSGPVAVAFQALIPFAAFLIAAIIVLIVIQFLGGNYNVNTWTGFIILFIIFASFVAYFVDRFKLAEKNPFFYFIYKMFSVDLLGWLKTDAGIAVISLILLVALFVFVMYGPQPFKESGEKMLKGGKEVARDIKLTFVEDKKP